MSEGKGSEKTRPTCDALPLREREDHRAWSLLDVLLAEASGRGIFRRSARTGSGARRVPLPRLCGAARGRPLVRRAATVRVHHRVPGVSKLHLMITLCAAHHAQVEHLQVVKKPMPPLLLKLWRERHWKGHEQTALNFASSQPEETPVPLLFESGEGLDS